MPKAKKTQKIQWSIISLVVVSVVAVVSLAGWVVTANVVSSHYSARKFAQTYTSNSGYTLLYPLDWKFIAKGTTDKTGEYGQDEFISLSDYAKSNNSRALMIFTSSIDKNKSLEAHVKELNVASKASGEGDWTSIKVESTVINGYEAVRNVVKVYGTTREQVFVRHGSLLVELVYDVSDEKKQIGFIADYEAIINSIQFTN